MVDSRNSISDNERGCIMKKFLGIAVLLVLTLALTACGDDPDPRFRVTNNYANSVNIGYKVADGNTVNMNGVATGTTSEWKTIPETTVTITGFPADTAKTQDPLTFATAKGYQYTVIVGADGRATVNKEDQ